MKTIVPNNRFSNILLTFLLFLLMGNISSAQTYTTIKNGAWSNASTWQGGVIPDANNITATSVVNIKHWVTYSGADINNYGTININNAAGLFPRLLVSGSINFTNQSTGKIYITDAEYRQFRYVGGGEIGTSQSGIFNNKGGYIQIKNSFVEVAQDWSNENSGTVVFKNSSLSIGRKYDLQSSAIDTISYTSISIGIQGSGDYTVDGLRSYFQAARFQVASNGGMFNLKGGTVNGTIEYITLKNHITGSFSNNKITAANGLNSTGLILGAYCVESPGKYDPNGKISGPQTSDCSLSYFPAGLIAMQSQASLNFSLDPVLISGLDKQVGAQYKYESVAPGMDAIVTITNIFNSASINTVDNNSGGVGYSEGFQPRIVSGSNVGESSVLFTFEFKITGTSTAHKMNTFSITGLDIDGGSNLKEFDEIGMGAGASASAINANPVISITQPVSGTFRGINMDGTEKTGIDTSAKENMFTVTNSNVSTFTLKVGVVTTQSTTSTREFSIYMKGFIYPNQSTLPVKLKSFDAVLNNSYKNVDVKWTTVSEINLSHFVIEKSTDGVLYNDLAMVLSNGSENAETNYSFGDNIANEHSNLIYYRLRSVDNSASYKLSETRLIRIDKSTEKTLKIVTYPNPVTSQLRVTIPENWQNKKVVYDLVTMNGQIVATIIKANSNQTETINVNNILPGIYLIKVSSGGEMLIQKIVKQ